LKLSTSCNTGLTIHVSHCFFFDTNFLRIDFYISVFKKRHVSYVFVLVSLSSSVIDSDLDNGFTVSAIIGGCCYFYVGV
jgi:hypothetical protein